jgi:hypothetical protein
MSEFNRDIPPEEGLDIPEGVNEVSINFFLELLGRIAQDYGLDAMTATPIEIDRPESLDAFIDQLEEEIKVSGKPAVEKEGAIALLKNLVEQMHIVLEAVRNS